MKSIMKVFGIFALLIAIAACDNSSGDNNGNTPPVVKVVSTRGEHTVVIKTDGTLWAWGDNYEGQFGDGSTAGRDTPVQIGTDKNWASVSTGGGYTVAIKTDGTLYAWGYNGEGQLGDNTTEDRHTPVKIGTDTDWAFVSAGGSHTVAMKTDGSLWTWGGNWVGQLGDGGTENKNTPTPVSGGGNWTSVSAYDNHTVAIKTDGTLWAWGSNDFGQLGDGTNTEKNTPTQEDSQSIDWAFVSTGARHTVAIKKTDHSLWSWGLNNFGQLGDETNIDRTIPVPIGTDTDWASVSAGYSHTAAIKTNGSLWAWGDNYNGQLGNGTHGFEVYKNTPTRIMP